MPRIHILPLAVTALFASALLLASPLRAHASLAPSAEIRKALPAAMSCIPADANALALNPNDRADPNTNTDATPFVFTHFNSPIQDPEWNGDGGFEGMELEGNRLSFDFNNGCDNNYGFTFKLTDLTALARGQAKKIHGELDYFNPYAGSDTQSSGRPGKTPVTCMLQLTPAD
jgi:hypothetical protein